GGGGTGHRPAHRDRRKPSGNGQRPPDRIRADRARPHPDRGGGERGTADHRSDRGPADLPPGHGGGGPTPRLPPRGHPWRGWPPRGSGRLGSVRATVRRFTHLGRTVSLAHPTHRALLALMAVGAVGGWINPVDHSPAVGMFRAAASVALTWMLVRELSPDGPWIALGGAA